MVRSIPTLIIAALVVSSCGPRETLSPEPTASLAIPNPTSVTSSTPSPTIKPTQPPSPSPEPTSKPDLIISDFNMIDTSIGWGMAELPDSEEENWSIRVLRTADGGMSWQDVSPQTDDSGDTWFDESFFLDTDNAWVAVASDEDVVIWHTADGGATWTSGEPLPHLIYQSRAMTFADSQYGWIMLREEYTMGSQGVAVIGSADGGINWEELTFTLTSDLILTPGLIYNGCGKIDIGFRDALTGWVTGSCNSGGFILEVTRDGGHWWEPGDPEPPAQDPDLFHAAPCLPHLPLFDSSQEGLFSVECGDYGYGEQVFLFYHTHDGGLSWDAPIRLVNPDALTTTFRYHFATISDGWYASWQRDFDLPPSVVLNFTHDGGQTWMEVTASGDIAQIESFDFVDPMLGWGAAYDQYESAFYLFKTTDGGVTWTKFIPRLLESLNR